MRSIQVTTEVFAKIWSYRLPGEEDENAILRRLLGLATDKTAHIESSTVQAAIKSKPKVLWRDDVKAALVALSREASLREIYDEVRNIRRREGRSLPVNVEPIIRRELETNSSDSQAHTGRFDWFRSVGGIGSGIWALRETNI